MRRFHCQFCKTEIYFDNTACVTCKRALGYLSDTFEMTAMEPAGDGWVTPLRPSQVVRLCHNARHDACNWLITDKITSDFCAACMHNRSIPDLNIEVNLANWRKIEQAKHYLFYSLMRWHLPLSAKVNGVDSLIFDFLADTPSPDGLIARVVTGHDRGVITLNVAEGDDAVREKRRVELREPYRTLLGHFRHEIGHYYWDLLVRDGDRLAQFRELFGDETASYELALKRHYEIGPPEESAKAFITTYATAHPWEDFAETWAHYIHIVDSLETAYAYGMSLSVSHGPSTDDAEVRFQPYAARNVKAIIDVWVPFTVALNCLNRSMGLRDFYPFVLSAPVLAKLQFVHDLIQANAQNSRA